REFNANLLVDFSSGRVDAGRLQLCFSGAGCFADSDSWWVEFDEAGDMTLHVDGESRHGGGSLYAILTGNQGQAVAGGFNLCALNGTQCLDSADGLFLLERENRYTYEEALSLTRDSLFLQEGFAHNLFGTGNEIDGESGSLLFLAQPS